MASRPIRGRRSYDSGLVPCPPELTVLLHAHVQEFGVQPDGRLFVGERNVGELPTMSRSGTPAPTPLRTLADRSGPGQAGSVRTTCCQGTYNTAAANPHGLCRQGLYKPW
jgi:hypothetical protein